MKRFFISLIFVFFNTLLLSQTPPDTLWTKTFGGNNSEMAYDFKLTSDDGFIIVGTTDSFGSGDKDAYLIKTNSNGDTLWTKVIGEIDSGDFANTVLQFNNNTGYIFAGQTAGYGASHTDAWIVKTDSLGNLLNSNTYGSIYADEVYSIVESYSNGYVLCGHKQVSQFESRMWLFEVNDNLDMIWEKLFFPSTTACAYSVKRTEDNGYIVVGNHIFDNSDIILIKTNSIGDTLWTKTIGGNDRENAMDVLQTSNNNYLIVGTKGGSTTPSDLYLVKTNEIGDTLWTKTYGGNDEEKGYEGYETYDGGFIINGSTSSYGVGNLDIWLIRIDIDGNTLWSKTFGTINHDQGRSVIENGDGSYNILGYISELGTGYEDIYFIKVMDDFTADLEAEPNFGYSSLNVDFTDKSYYGIVSNWFWDFDNDGIYDSIEQNPSYEYTQPGVYDVKLKIVNNALVDSLIKTNCIIVQNTQLSPPQNFVINISNDNLNLQWSAVSGANYYLIYKAENPNDEFDFLDYTYGVTNYTHSGITTIADKMFYIVIGFDGTMEELTKFINHNQRKNFNVETK